MMRAFVLALLVAAGCQNGHGLVMLSVSVPSGSTLAVDYVTVHVTDQTRTPARVSSAFSITVPGGSLPPALTIPLLFDHDIDGMVLITVDAKLPDATTETASTEAQVSTYHTTTATVTLPIASIQPPPPPSDDMATCAGANLAFSSKYVINAFFAPTNRSDYAYDLNGDGKPDNQFGSLCSVLTGQGYGLQAALDAEVSGGTDLLLLELDSRDSGFSNDTCAASHVRNAVDQANPSFSPASSSFTPDTTPESLFDGALATGSFASLPAPAVATTPVQLHIKLPLSGETLIPLTGGHVTYTVGVDHLLNGEIQGAIAIADLNGIFIPAVAKNFTALVTQTPCGSDCTSIKALFDNGGVANSKCAGTCANPDGTCAVANDNKIDICEITTNNLVANLLSPDVQMTDGKGNYQPAPTNALPDSLSLGIGFTAVTTQYKP